MVILLASVFADRQVFVFVSIVSAILILTASVFVFNVINPVLFGLGLLVLGVAAFAAPRMVEFKEYERGVLFRMGRLRGVIGPGWVWVIPLTDKFERVDLRAQVVDIKPQKVISKDGVALTIDSAVNYRIKDPAKYALSAKNISQMFSLRATSALREASARLDYLDIISGSEKLNAALHAEVGEEAAKWGIEITTAEIEHIELPKDLLEAMRQKEAAIQRKDAVETEASIKQIYLQRLDEAAGKLSPATMNYLYLDSLRRMSLSKSSKIVVPFELFKLLPLGLKPPDGK